MNTAEFLARILPPTGLYVIARIIKGKFKHTVCDSIEEAAAYALNYDQAGVNVYHACAAYREREVITTKPNGDKWKQVRTHKNVRAMKSFWTELDVDLADPKKFKSQEAALDALVDFCSITHLPMPLTVNSGGGIHLYWTLENEILPETWKQTAESLKSLFAAVEFKASRERTADMSSVLRPVGTTNHKTNPGRAVELILDAAAVDYAAFAGQVAAALKAAGVKPPEGVRRTVAQAEALNQAFAVKTDFPPCSGVRVAERCAQVARFRDQPTTLTEPHLYAAIQLLTCAIEGDELIHLWASGHPNYNRASGYIDGKIAQIRGQGIGPTLCATFEDRNAGGCDGCPFAGKISSPAQLGTVVLSAPAPTVEIVVAEVLTTITLPLPPLPFTRGENGGIYVEEEGITSKVYEYDAFPVELAYDEQLGHETMRIKHWLPNESWRECTVRSALLAKPADFEMQLRDNHIQPLIRNKMAMYFDAYLRKMRTETKMRQLYKAQGWKSEDTEFVLGDTLYKKDAKVQAGFSSGARGFLEHFKTKGSLKPWKELTRAFSEPGLEPHAFMLLCAFAAPLLKLDNRKGFTISAIGPTGAGKSTMGQFMASVYGHPEDTWIKRDDTNAARMERIGAYHSLPVYMDEITTIEPKDLRALVYSIATGKGRDSLKQDRTLREGAQWSTILVTSTNDSLQAKLQQEKTNAEAESMRLFEFRFPMEPLFGHIAPLVPEIVFNNYGHAGAKYIEYIVNNLQAVRAGVHEAILATESEFGMDAKERFWSQAVALALYGGKRAKKLRLLDFDPETIKPWLLKETKRMRYGIVESHVNAVGLLANWLNAHTSERLVVTKLNATMTVQGLKPMRGLSQRYERDTNVLYISRKCITDDLRKGHADVSEVREELAAMGILTDDRVNKTLGAGTEYTGAPTLCWRLKTDHPELAGVVE